MTWWTACKIWYH